jgi:1,4-alpha-glucan branching enzyme
MKPGKSSRSGSRTRAIRLEIFRPDATDVCVAGSFNEWRPQATPMIPLGDGKWVKELTLPDGRYEYRFVVDGVWLTDSNAEENIPNPFGSMNSVLTINGKT